MANDDRGRVDGVRFDVKVHQGVDALALANSDVGNLLDSREIGHPAQGCHITPAGVSAFKERAGHRRGESSVD